MMEKGGMYMKRIVCTVMAAVMFVVMPCALAERTDHQKTLLKILTESAKANDTFEDAYYDEKNDAYVLIVKDEKLSSTLFETICKTDKTFRDRKAEICKENLCTYFMDWMDLFNLDIPVIIKHVTSDDVLMFCMKDGNRYDYDVLEEERSEDDKLSEAAMNIMLLMLENQFKEEDGIILKTSYDEENKEAHFKFVMLNIDRNYLNTKAGKQFKAQMKDEFADQFYPVIKDKFEGNNIEGLSMIVELATSDGQTITMSKDGKVIK